MVEAAATRARASACIVCERPAPFPTLFERGPYRIVRCPGCQLAFQDPQPAAAERAESYYLDERFTAALEGPLRELTVERARRKLPLVRAVLPDPSAGRTLDVGCSSGAWLELMATAGWTATGVEIGPSTAGEARRRGLDVRTGTLAETMPELSGERFDLITFWDVLEHLPDPRRELDLAGRLLAPEGVLAATFPNVEGWYPRLTRWLFAGTVGAWEHPELPEHLYDFSPRTARALLERCGYEVVAARTSDVPFEHYRETVFSRWRRRFGWRALPLRLAFELLHLIVYPIAGRFDRGNYQFVAARPAA